MAMLLPPTQEQPRRMEELATSFLMQFTVNMESQITWSTPSLWFVHQHILDGCVSACWLWYWEGRKRISWLGLVSWTPTWKTGVRMNSKISKLPDWGRSLVIPVWHEQARSLPFGGSCLEACLGWDLAEALWLCSWGGALPTLLYSTVLLSMVQASEQFYHWMIKKAVWIANRLSLKARCL